MFGSYSLLSHRGELSLAVICMNDAALAIDATVVGTANARRTTLAEGAGGPTAVEGPGFEACGWPLILSTFGFCARFCLMRLRVRPAGLSPAT